MNVVTFNNDSFRLRHEYEGDKELVRIYDTAKYLYDMTLYGRIKYAYIMKLLSFPNTVRQPLFLAISVQSLQHSMIMDASRLYDNRCMNVYSLRNDCIRVSRGGSWTKIAACMSPDDYKRILDVLKRGEKHGALADKVKQLRRCRNKMFAHNDFDVFDIVKNPGITLDDVCYLLDVAGCMCVAALVPLVSNVSCLSWREDIFRKYTSDLNISVLTMS